MLRSRIPASTHCCTTFRVEDEGPDGLVWRIDYEVTEGALHSGGPDLPELIFSKLENALRKAIHASSVSKVPESSEEGTVPRGTEQGPEEHPVA